MAQEDNFSRTISLKSMRVFCVAARSLSFKQAAEDLFITASAVSHQIRSLEERLDTELFVRGTRSLKLSNRGNRLFQVIEPLLNQVDREINAFAGAHTRVLLQVVLPPFFATEFFIPMLSQFTSLHPQIDIHLDTDVHRPDKHPTSADLSVLLCRQEPLDINYHELFPLILTPVCAKDYRVECAPDNTTPISDEVTWIIHNSRPDAWEKWFGLASTPKGQTERVLVLDSMTAISKAVEQGLGVALMPRMFITKAFENGQIRQFHPSELITSDKYYLGWESSNENSEEIEVFIDWVSEQLSQYA